MHEQAICVRLNPDLEDARRPRIKIELSLPNTGACAHHLNVAGNDATRAPDVVAMTHGAVADISDDFHVGVSVRREA